MVKLSFDEACAAALEAAKAAKVAKELKQPPQKVDEAFSIVQDHLEGKIGKSYRNY